MYAEDKDSLWRALNTRKTETVRECRRQTWTELAGDCGARRGAGALGCRFLMGMGQLELWAMTIGWALHGKFRLAHMGSTWCDRMGV